MKNREQLLTSPAYWFEHEQNELFRIVHEYMEREQINQSELAERLNVSKGYVSQILNGNFNYTLKKLIEISLKLGQVPCIEYKSVQSIIKSDKRNAIFYDFAADFNEYNIAPIVKTCARKSDRINKAGIFNSNRMVFEDVNC
jgi:transcriptional regulator with XRE-family HTH domain